MVYHQYIATEKGGPEVLEWQEFEPGPPQYGEVAVKVEASGVLLADVLWQLGVVHQYIAKTLTEETSIDRVAP